MKRYTDAPPGARLVAPAAAGFWCNQGRKKCARETVKLRRLLVAVASERLGLCQAPWSEVHRNPPTCCVLARDERILALLVSSDGLKASSATPYSAAPARLAHGENLRKQLCFFG